MAFSTGVSLLPVGGSALKSSIRTFLEMKSGTHYVNEVTGVTATSLIGGTNAQTTVGQVNATLGTYHLINNPQSGDVLRTISNTQVMPDYPATFVTKDMSVAFWLKGDSDGGFGASNVNNRFMLFGTGTSSNTSWVGIGVSANNSLTVYNNASSTGTTWTTDSSWRLYVFNFQYNIGTSNFTVTCYIDGSLQANSYNMVRFDTSNYWLFTSSVFPVLNTPDFDNNCGIDNLSIQDKVLSLSEVQYLYNLGAGLNYSSIL
jgi:hypothetical protein